MLSIGAVTAGNADYYTEQVAYTAEEYYSGRGEAEGTWIGGAMDEIEVSGKVSVKEFNRVLAGLDPKLEAYAPNLKGRRNLGFDMTFSAPKSVSIFFAAGSDHVRSQVQAAHDQAVLEGFAYMEEHAAWGREGKAGKNKVQGAGLAASVWRHRTSREGDPQLHSHVVTANMIRTEHGRWVSLDSGRIWNHAKAGGTIYQAALRREMTRRLGVSWGEVINGQADIEGIDREAIEAVSKRRAQLQEHMEENGMESRAATNKSAILTRKAKGKADSESLFEDWKKELGELGISAESIEKLCAGQRLSRMSEKGAAEVMTLLSEGSMLTRERAYFDRRKVIEAVADLVPPTVGPRQIEQLADRWIRDQAVVVSEKTQAPVQRAGQVGRAGERILTTPAQVALEAAAVSAAAGRAGSGVGVIDERAKDFGLAKHGATLYAEQREMVERILGSGNGVDVVVGDAGTGKTYSLSVLRAVYEDAGYNVIGAALAAQAARELQGGASIRAETIHRTLIELDGGGAHEMAGGKNVLVVDEAAMVETDLLQRLLAHAQSAGMKVVLVGDDKQLPAIGAGGVFRGLADRLGHSRLQENRRQRREEDREIVRAFMDGRGHEGLLLADRAGRLTIKETSDETVAALYSKWSEDPDREDALMIAGLRREVRELNSRAQTDRFAAGELGEQELRLGVYNYRVGDRVRCGARDADRIVVNGDFATVVALDTRARSVTIQTDDGREVTLPRGYASDPEKLQLGYAITAHSAQGATRENAYVLLNDRTYRELGYTAVSRARGYTEIFVTAAPIEPQEAGYQPDKNYEELELVINALAKSEAQALAIDTGQVDRFGGRADEDLIYELTAHRAKLDSALADEVEAEAQAVSEAEGSAPSDKLKAWTAEHPEEVASYRALHNEIERRVAMRVQLLEEKPPAYLTREIGPRPAEGLALTYWRQAAMNIERYRMRWLVGDKQLALSTKSTAGSKLDDPAFDTLKARNRKHVFDKISQAKQAIKKAPVQMKGRSL